MKTNIKDYIFRLREEGLVFYVAVGFICTALMQANSLLFYWLQQNIFFDTIIGFMPIKVIMFFLEAGFVLMLITTLISNEKANKFATRALNELNKRTRQICYISSFSCAGIALFCALPYFLYLIIGKENDYGKYFITFFITSLFFISIHPLLGLLAHHIIIPMTKDTYGKIIAILLISIVIIIPYFYNKTETMTITIDKEKYQQIKEKTKMKPEDYIKNEVNALTFD